ncbi:N-acetylmuramoyl-L-alanine amidase [Saccharothrix coeruleofusca]|uniref:N-acetylmuramoyl-L-alanine amidase n=1 Tax=Saccharothrix coeruleofusca TaxID=33919 RepID=A0A918ASH2_9PSEU|nr:N-acetylmuramoyl-L-alanine amidase [Saccharothrix coeruleofusca]MBP2335436.1 hypothetical protein [Saccharothrix coeruleofusca]GGP77765.1 amidase [Saccharothrix coeruleofusca]
MRTTTASLSAVALLAALVVAQPAASAAPDGQDEYTAAAREFGVPVSVLLGVSYLQSRWDGNAGEPSRAGGYGPMHLTDGARLRQGEHHDGEEDPRGDTARPLSPRQSTPTTTVPDSLRTIDRAAELTGVPLERLRSDRRQNIRGGAALLARYQRELGAPASEPGAWYGAVARYSGAEDVTTARQFADDVFDVIRSGATRTTDSGTTVTLPADAGVRPAVEQVDRLGLRPPEPGAECPARLGCEWLPAPYEHYDPSDPGAYGNHDQARRPRDLDIRYIVVHDTEATYDRTLDLVRDPTYVSWQYTIRSSDGHVAQHVKAEDVAWHAGNWYVNAHSIGIEHEGFAAQGTWYTESMYRSSSRLVRYLAQRYGVPLDRAHIIGHDNVPGTVPSTVRGMHWDPGPYWDWAHYFDLLGAPLRGVGGSRSASVLIKPDFATNRPAMTGCDSARPADPCPARGSTSVFLHTEPSEDSPLVPDIGLRPDGSASTRQVSDIGGRVDTGQRFAVAERRGEWTAIWYLGGKAWLRNPPSAPTAVGSGGWLVTPKRGLPQVSVYGRAYPEEAAYEGTGVPYQAVTPLQYALPAGQFYAVGDLRPPTAYYFAQTWEGPRVVVRGDQRYYEIQFGHRVAFVKASEVDLTWRW